MNLYIYNENTCARVNLYGTEVKELFLANGHVLTAKSEADILLINTCSFLQSKESYFLDLLRTIHEEKAEHQTVIIIGCLKTIGEEKIKAASPDAIILGRDISQVIEIFHFENKAKAKATHIMEPLSSTNQFIRIMNDVFLHSRHIDFRLKKENVCYIQIATGCKGHCTYCSERFTTSLKSQPIIEILGAIKQGLNDGYTMFSLSSDDASAYGSDLGTNLDVLLTEILKIKRKDMSIIIPEFNPNGLTDNTIELLKDGRFLYITIPIQSGSQKILDSMKRPYQINEVIREIKQIRENNPKLMINSHLIVGFPGETQKDFAKTIQLIETGLLDRVKVFKYSPRTNTAARDFPYQVNDIEKERRKRLLLKAIQKQAIKKMSLTNFLLNLQQLG